VARRDREVHQRLRRHSSGRNVAVAARNRDPRARCGRPIHPCALGQACLDWLQRREAGARMLRSPVSGVGYVLGTFPCDWDRDDGRALLEAHCRVARSPSVLNDETVVGLGAEIYNPAASRWTASTCTWRSGPTPTKTSRVGHLNAIGRGRCCSQRCGKSEVDISATSRPFAVGAKWKCRVSARHQVIPLHGV
jgi:hypothetical protein